jgi:hypothetical protein
MLARNTAADNGEVSRPRMFDCWKLNAIARVRLLWRCVGEGGAVLSEAGGHRKSGSSGWGTCAVEVSGRLPAAAARQNSVAAIAAEIAVEPTNAPAAP